MQATAEANCRISTTYRCHHCQQTSHAVLDESQVELACSRCGAKTAVTINMRDARWLACPFCRCDELFWRKDFPQRLGVIIVVLGFAISCVTWYFHMLIATFAVLLLMALIDVALYMSVGDLLECYRCHAQFRGCPTNGQHAEFNLETFEKHRQVAARNSLAQQGSRATLENASTKVRGDGQQNR